MNRKILIIEDNEMNRDMLSRFLLVFEYEVLVATNGWKGIELAKAASPGLILMDISLPDIDGCEITRRLKSDPDTCHIPVMALTAGCDEYETKPIDFSRLMKKIDAFLLAGNDVAVQPADR